MKRIAGKADPVAEVYKVVTSQRTDPRFHGHNTLRAKFESLACFKKSVAEMPGETPTTQARLRAAREAMLSKFCTSDNDGEYERIHAAPFNEALGHKEAMRLCVASGRGTKDNGGRVSQEPDKGLPPALVCSARLP